MPTRALEFDWPDRAVVGTIGLPGARTFYFQVRSGPQLVTIALEKQQSSLLAEKIDEILDQLVTVEGKAVYLCSRLLTAEVTRRHS